MPALLPFLRLLTLPLLAVIAPLTISGEGAFFSNDPVDYVSKDDWHVAAARIRTVYYWVDPQIDPFDQSMIHASAEAWSECGAVSLVPVALEENANLFIRDEMPFAILWGSKHSVGVTFLGDSRRTDLFYTRGKLYTHSVITHEIGHAILMPHVPDTVMNAWVRMPPFWGVEPELCSILVDQWRRVASLDCKGACNEKTTNHSATSPGVLRWIH